MAGSIPTARGDRDGRRRDVLTAAAEILDESGLDGLSIRATAARAGVSAGAVYQWFSGKDEILGELYDREVRAGLELIETVADLPLDEVMRLMLDLAVNLHDKLGRPEVQFAASDGQGGREIGPTMRSTHARLGERVDEMLDRAAAAENLTLVEDEHRLRSEEHTSELQSH